MEGGCPFCSLRPETPSKAFFLEDGKDRDKKEWLRKNYQHKNDDRIRHERKREEYKR